MLPVANSCGRVLILAAIVAEVWVLACYHLKEALMVFDYVLSGIVTAGLLVYLTYALLRPERF